MFCLTEDLCCFVGLVRTGWVFHKHTRRLFSGILNRRLLHPSLPGRQRRSCLPRPLKQTKTNKSVVKGRQKFVSRVHAPRARELTPLTLLNNRLPGDVVDRKHGVENVTGSAERKKSGELLGATLQPRSGDDGAACVTSSRCRPSGQTGRSSPWPWTGPPCSCSLLG